MKIIAIDNPELIEFCKGLTDRDLWTLLNALQTELLDRAMPRSEMDELVKELENADP